MVLLLQAVDVRWQARQSASAARDAFLLVGVALEGARVRELAEQGMLTGASGRNWSAYGKEIELAAERNAIDQALLSDPQTSGGLLVACTPESVDEVLAIFHQHGFADACEVGEITPASADGIKLKVC
jgi:selenide,water dikinase